MGIHKLGNILTQAQPIELCLGNITRRVLFFIRDSLDQLKYKQQKQTQAPIQSFFSPELSKEEVQFKDLKNLVLEEINGLLDELDGLYNNIANQALDHIHSNEIIMTYGRSNTVVNFFKAAASKRKFHVVIAESAPSYKGKLTAKELAEAGIDSTLIADSAIFCMMSRVNKVIVGTNAVLANGGLLALSGGRMLAEAAKYYSVPFVVISGMYKLSPVYPSGKDFINDMSSPGNIISFKDVDSIEIDSREVDVLNPVLDYIPPELVSLYLTNYGVHNPSYIYRMLAEYYSLQDYTFSSKYDEDLIKVKNILALQEEEIVDALEWFLGFNQGFDVNQSIEDNTLLEFARERNNAGILKLLLSRDDILVSDKVAQELAQKYEQDEEIQRLLHNLQNQNKSSN